MMGHKQNNLIANKLREQMYLRHLRQVERINNREAESIKKELKQYHSISGLHKKNKEMSQKHKIFEMNRSIEDKNKRIQFKIKHIGSDQQIKQHSKTVLLATETPRPINTSRQKIVKSELPQQNKDTSRTQNVHTLHYSYRKRQQQLIEEQNNKIFKAIVSQKSALLPLLGKSRCSSDLSKGKQNMSQNIKENNDSPKDLAKSRKYSKDQSGK